MTNNKSVSEEKKKKITKPNVVFRLNDHWFLNCGAYGEIHIYYRPTIGSSEGLVEYVFPLYILKKFHHWIGRSIAFAERK